VIEHDSILHPLIPEPHLDPILYPSNNDLIDSDVDSENACIDAELPPVWTHIYGTSHLDDRLAGMPVTNEYFDIFQDEIDLWS